MVEGSRQAGAGAPPSPSRSWRRWPGWVGYAAGLMFVRLMFTGELASILGEGVLTADNWVALAPELLWPLWGAALGAAALAYYRRRGRCGHCGRA